MDQTNADPVQTPPQDLDAHAVDSEDLEDPVQKTPAPSSSANRAQSPPRRQRACVPCTRAKARCHFRDENVERHVCDRCHRLQIDCAAKTTKSLRKPRQIKPLLSRVASLEQKLETMTSLLAAAQGSDKGQVSSPENSSTKSPPGQNSYTHHSLTIRTPESVTSHGTESPAQAPVFTSGPPAVNVSSGTYVPAPQPQPRISEASPPFGITWQEAQVILDLYRDTYMLRFPFIVIDSDVTPKELLEERPFLFRSIVVAVTPYSPARVKKMVRNVRAYLCHRMIVNSERTLDLLQGLLISIAWSRANPFGDSELTNLTYLALGYAHNLGITKVPVSVLRFLGRDNLPDDLRYKTLHATNPDAHTPEQQRTLLGLYCILSGNSMQYGRTNPLQVDYINICTSNLVYNTDVPSDFMGEKMVRLIQMAEKISAQFGGAHDRERQSPYAFLAEDNVKRLRVETDQIAEGVDSDHPLYQPFRIHYFYVLVRLYEPATYFRDTGAHTASPDWQYRNRSLFECLRAVRLLLETATALPPSAFRYITVASAQQVNFTVIMGSRLLLLNAPGWDLGVARSRLDLVNLVDQLIKLVNAANEEYLAEVKEWKQRLHLPDDDEAQQGDPEFGTLAAYAGRATSARDWYISRLEKSQAAGTGGGEAQHILGAEMDLDLASFYSQSMAEPFLPMWGLPDWSSYPRM